MSLYEDSDRSSTSHLIDCFLQSTSLEALAYLEAFVMKGEFRDEQFTNDDYSATFKMLNCTTDPYCNVHFETKLLVRVRDICLKLIQSDEFDSEKAMHYVPNQFIKHMVERAMPTRINTEIIDRECRFIQSTIMLIYRKFPSMRPCIRREIGKFLRDYAVIPTRTSHLTPILIVLNAILSGMSEPDPIVFREILLPLHRPNGWSFWDRQTPILAEYHKPLVQCCFVYIERDRSYATELVDYLLSTSFPPVHQANTPKELLLLFEMNKFVNYIDLNRIKAKFFAKILECLDSENAQIVQSALSFWKSPPSDFPTAIIPFLHEYMEPLVMILFRGSGEPHWNPTVNKMTLIVLKNLRATNRELFDLAASRIPPTRFEKTQVTAPLVASKVAAEVHTGHQPPLGITGIAPWSNEPSIPSTKNFSTNVTQDTSLSGLEAMEEYMSRLCPSDDSSSVDNNSKSWQLALSSETPTLLPDLKFHNLVFGRDLGSGSFSTVRYARVVKPGGKTFLSQWDEVAVKIINYETIGKNNYGENILREICCLRQLAHPSIARLISSFKWRDGIYLVLEYGALGDLHSYIRSHGPLVHDSISAKIVVGEIATALVTVHESGYVYGDLKPENVVITATRHVKLADFGACRPVTRIAKELVLQSRDALSNMRSGDWKIFSSETANLPQLSEQNILNPKTFEGTTVYLSPEVVSNHGTAPTILSDAWALGMTMYFILIGRLPGWSSGIVGDTTTQINLAQLIKTDGNLESFHSILKSLFFSLFEMETDKRLSVEDAIVHEWFDDVQEVRLLYKRDLTKSENEHLPGIDQVGDLNRRREESQWEKRQLSKIWTAQPVDFALVANGHDGQDENGDSDNRIAETDFERYSPFL